MDKKEIKKRKRKRNRLIKSLVIVFAFVIAISATFGATMAYFGGKSDKVNYDMVLKMGLFVGTPTQSTNEVYAYVVPSQVVTAQCEFTVKSAKDAGSDASVSDEEAGTDIASDGLIRAKIEFSGITGVTLDNGTQNQVYFPVKLIDGDTNPNIGYFVKRDKANDGSTDDGYYYLITTTSLTDNDANMYVVDTSTGEKKFTFDLRVSIPKSLTNTQAGEKITLNVTYEVIQADFFSAGNINADNKTVKNAYTIFQDSTIQSGDASYNYGEVAEEE